MSREITEDVAVLTKYLTEFNLGKSVCNPDYINNLKSMHKKAFGFLLFFVELNKQNSEEPVLSKISIRYLNETGSDIIQSLFSWAVGSYKSANMMLRSSIETFLKAIIGNEDDKIYDEKSVYTIFENAKLHSFFTSELGKKKLQIMHSVYRELCMISHSAREIELGTITSLNHLPRYDRDLARKYKSVYHRQIEAMLCMILFNFYRNVLKMHPLNRDTFLSTVTLTTKKEVFDIIGSIDLESLNA